MDFKFTEEQVMIRDAADAFLLAEADSAAVRTAMASELGYDPAFWRALCDQMYWHVAHIPEQYGGLGLGYVELCIVMQAMGKRLACAPFFSTVALAANGLLLAGNEAQREQWLPRIAEGQTATLAFHGGGRAWDATAVSGEFTGSGDTYTLNGDYCYVVDGHSADLLLIAARNSQDQHELALFMLDADTAGIERQWQATMDQTRKQASLSLSNVTVAGNARLAGCQADGSTLDTLLDLACIALAAEQCGGTDAILRQAVAYTQEREQFGRTIASFQAIKHKAADIALKSEVAMSAVFYAACVADEYLAGSAGDGELAAQLPEAAAMAKAYCSDAYFFAAGNAMQMYGGVGFTWEYDAHLYFKRAKSSEVLLGNGAWHRERIATGLLGPANGGET